ncbi:MAG: Lrp/AsnC family transcriptional regulator [Rhodospirillales bacterium]|nr:Lrp/AsnC family transcriptional regulator [Rhodospirillales bacterium]
MSASAFLKPLDRAIVKATQAGLPLVAEPWKAVADLAGGVREEEVMESARAMLASGVMRRIGAVPNHYALGYVANGMTVWDVGDEAIEEAGRMLAGLDFVTHCYHRPRHMPDWPYNLFAMVHDKDRTKVEARVEEMAALLGSRSRGHDVLYSTRILKKTGLRIGA